MSTRDDDGIKIFGCTDPATGLNWIPIKLDSNGRLQVTDPPSSGDNGGKNAGS